jgi:hypothetical protein
MRAPDAVDCERASKRKLLSVDLLSQKSLFSSSLHQSHINNISFHISTRKITRDEKFFADDFCRDGRKIKIKFILLLND